MIEKSNFQYEFTGWDFNKMIFLKHKHTNIVVEKDKLLEYFWIVENN